MFDTPAKLKNFILWCQKNKVKSFSGKEVSFELSELSFIPEANDYKEINLEDSSTFSDLSNLDKDETEDLLFWSSGQTPGKG